MFRDEGAACDDESVSAEPKSLRDYIMTFWRDEEATATGRCHGLVMCGFVLAMVCERVWPRFYEAIASVLM